MFAHVRLFAVLMAAPFVISCVGKAPHENDDGDLQSQRSSLGAEQERLDDESTQSLGLVLVNREDGKGWVVKKVVADSPAERAGIVEGDRVRSINGYDMGEGKETTYPEVSSQLGGSDARVIVERNRKRLTFDVDTERTSNLYSAEGSDADGTAQSACVCFSRSCYPNCYYYSLQGYTCGTCYLCACV